MMAQQHLVAMLFGAFAALALSLAAVGLYSVVSSLLHRGQTSSAFVWLWERSAATL